MGGKLAVLLIILAVISWSQADVQTQSPLRAFVGSAALATPTELRDAFKELDADSSGLIALNDLKILNRMSRMGISDDQLKQMIEAADGNGDGKITFEEFVRSMKGR